MEEQPQPGDNVEQETLEQPQEEAQEPEEEDNEPISPTEESRFCISSAIEAYNFLESLDEQGTLALNNDMTHGIRKAMVQCIRIVCSEVPRLLDSEELKKEIRTDW
jgi:hypothetical protein